jgi:hypothetical protein
MTMRRTAVRPLVPAATLLCAMLAASSVPLAAQAADPARIVSSDDTSSTSPRAASGPGLKADYKFEGSLTSSVKGAPRLRNVGKGNFFRRERVPGEGRTRVLVFPKGNGLKVQTKGLIPSKQYSVVMQFRLVTAGKDTYARVLNPTLPADDNDSGLYLYNRRLVWYDSGDNNGMPRTVAPKKYVEVAFTRNANGTIRVYVNGRPDISYADDDNQAVIQNHLLRFFIDNSNNEESKGAVSRIRLYNDALAAKRVKQIYNQGH